VQTNRLKRRRAGEQVVFGTILLVGSKDWTVIGKPTVPHAKVKATIEQQTLCKEIVSYRRNSRKPRARLYRVRSFVSMLRIDEIIMNSEPQEERPTTKPLRLLDLWANRWLYPEEYKGCRLKDDGTPVAADIYDGSEHQTGSYHDRGLEDCYRYYPDPSHSHWMS